MLLYFNSGGEADPDVPSDYEHDWNKKILKEKDLSNKKKIDTYACLLKFLTI